MKHTMKEGAQIEKLKKEWDIIFENATYDKKFSDNEIKRISGIDKNTQKTE